MCPNQTWWSYVVGEEDSCREWQPLSNYQGMKTAVSMVLNQKIVSVTLYVILHVLSANVKMNCVNLLLYHDYWWVINSNIIIDYIVLRS